MEEESNRSQIKTFAEKLSRGEEPYFSVALLVKRKIVEDIESRGMFKSRSLLALRSERYPVSLFPQSTIPYVISRLPEEYKETDFIRQLNAHRLSRLISAMLKNGDLPSSEVKHSRYNSGMKYLFQVERKWYNKTKEVLRQAGIS